MAKIEEYSDANLEREALAALLTNEEAGMVHIPQLLPNHFTDENLRRLFSLAFDYVTSSGGPLTRGALRVELGVRYPKETSEEIVGAILGLYDALLMSPESTPANYLIGRLVQFTQARNMLHSVKKTLELLDAGKLEDGLKEYSDGALELESASADLIVTRGEVFEDYKARKELLMDMQANPEKYRGVLTGIDGLDGVTSGLWEGELGFVFGKSGVGKSFFLLQIAYAAFLAGLRVLVIPIEMPMIQWARRFDSRISHVAYDRFKWANISDGELEQWEGRMEQVKNDFAKDGAAVYISHIPMGCTLGSIRAEIERLARNGTPIDMLVVDYADLMSPPRQLYSEQGELTAIFRELKGLSGVYNIPVWTATQSRRESYQKSSLDMGDVGYAMGKVHVSDLVVGLSCTDGDKLAGRMWLNIVKYRDGTLDKPIALRPNLGLAMIDEVI